jgi:hypothetical protein
MLRDLLGECNDKGAPLDEFIAGWCARCLNPDCTRSLHGKTKFDVRVNTWEERLFLNPPRMPSEDPRYENIAGQRFLTIDVGRTPEVRSDWIDPNSVMSSEPDLTPAPEPVFTTPVPQPPSVGGHIPQHLVLANAPDQSGKVLPGASKEPVKDPWGVPEPTTEKILPIGGTFKMGSGV